MGNYVLGLIEDGEIELPEPIEPEVGDEDLGDEDDYPDFTGISGFVEHPIFTTKYL